MNGISIQVFDAQGRVKSATSGGATGDVNGPGSSTNSAIALFDGTGGKDIKNSVVTIDGSGNVSGASLPASAIASGTIATARLPALSVTSLALLHTYVLHDEMLLSNGSFDVDLTAINSPPVDGETVDWITGLLIARTTAGAFNDQIYFLLNNDTTVANYRVISSGADSTPAGIAVAADTPFAGFVPAASASGTLFGVLEFTIPFIKTTAHEKVIHIRNSHRTSSTGIEVRNNSIYWENAAAVTRFAARADGHSGDLLATNSRLILLGHKVGQTVVSGVAYS